MDDLDNQSKRKRRAAAPATPGKSPRAKPKKSVAPEAVDPDRREKIAKLKQSIADGTYRVSSEDVARKVIEHMLERKR